MVVPHMTKVMVGRTMIQVRGEIFFYGHTLNVNPIFEKNMAQHTIPEPLLDESQTRFTLFPIAHNDIWEDYKTLMSSIYQ